MNTSQTAIRIFILPFVLCSLAAGCLSVGTPREITVNTEVGRREHVDASSVPPTKDHEEARQKLAEAYTEIRSLRADAAKLERDKKDLKRERDDCRKQGKELEKAQKKLRKESRD